MRKFEIPRASATATMTKSIRFSEEVIGQVEEAIRGTGCTFSAFVIEAVRVALDNLEEESDSAQK